MLNVVCLSIFCIFSFASFSSWAVPDESAPRPDREPAATTNLPLPKCEGMLVAKCMPMLSEKCTNYIPVTTVDITGKIIPEIEKTVLYIQCKEDNANNCMPGLNSKNVFCMIEPKNK